MAKISNERMERHLKGAVTLKIAFAKEIISNRIDHDDIGFFIRRSNRPTDREKKNRRPSGTLDLPIKKVRLKITERSLLLRSGCLLSRNSSRGKETDYRRDRCIFKRFKASHCEAFLRLKIKQENSQLSLRLFSCLFLLWFFAPFLLLIHHRHGRWKQGKEAKRVEERVVVVLSVMGNRQKKKLSLDCRITRNYTITFTVYGSCRVRLLDEPS